MCAKQAETRAELYILGLDPDKRYTVLKQDVQFGFISDDDVPGCRGDLQGLMGGVYGGLAPHKAVQAIVADGTKITKLRNAIRSLASKCFRGPSGPQVRRAVDEPKLLPRLLDIVATPDENPRACMDANLLIGLLETAPRFKRDFFAANGSRKFGQALLSAAALVDAAGQTRSSIGLPAGPPPADILKPQAPVKGRNGQVVTSMTSVLGGMGESLESSMEKLKGDKALPAPHPTHDPGARPVRPAVPEHLLERVRRALEEHRDEPAAAASSASASSAVAREGTAPPDGTPGADFALDERYLVNFLNRASGVFNQSKHLDLVMSLVTGGFVTAVLHVARAPGRGFDVKRISLKLCYMMMQAFGGLIPPLVESMGRDGLFELACDVVADAMRGGIEGINGGHRLEVMARKNALNEAIAVLGLFCNEQMDHVVRALCDHLDVLPIMGNFIEEVCAMRMRYILEENQSMIDGFKDRTERLSVSRCDDLGAKSTEYPMFDWAKLAVRVMSEIMGIMARGGKGTLPIRRRLANAMAKSGYLKRAMWASMAEFCDEHVSKLARGTADTLDKETLLIMGRVLCDGSITPRWFPTSTAEPEAAPEGCWVPGTEDPPLRNSLIGAIYSRTKWYLQGGAELKEGSKPEIMSHTMTKVLATAVRSRFARPHIADGVQKATDAAVQFGEVLLQKTGPSLQDDFERKRVEKSVPAILKAARLAQAVLRRARHVALSRFRVAAALQHS